MGDLTKVLEGTVENVKAALAGKSHVDLQELRKQEAAGQNRSGVLQSIDKALKAERAGGDTSTAEETAGASGDVADAPEGERHGASATTATDLDHSAPADIAPATEFEPSGAPVQTTAIDTSHPAVDANPRANTTEIQNRIDFNDPSLDGREIVEAALKA